MIDFRRTKIRPVRRSIRKSPYMMICFFCLWGFSIVLFGPRLLSIILSSRNAAEFILLAVFFGLLLLFWLMAAYYIAVVLFAQLSRPAPCPSETCKAEQPAVAILYPTCNDFQAEAVLSCIEQNYPDFHVFLLDDSSEKKYISNVDAFHSKYPTRTTVIRRPTRQGFKAGNLNNALKSAAGCYPYFAVVDADERLPDDFLSRTIAVINSSDYAFVQANHVPNPEQDSAFVADIAPTILPFWHVHCRPRNCYGLVLYLGHGAVIRRSAWDSIGGFPEVITEDLAFSALLAKEGMRGVFLDHLICYEDFPANYPAFKRQQERYVIGTTQVMRKYLFSVLCSRKMLFIEKLDFCLWSLPLYVPALCLLFVIVSSIGLTGILGNWGTLVISVFGKPVSLPIVRLYDGRFTPLWLFDFQLFSVICALAPTFACLSLGIRKKLHAIRLLFLSTVPFMSLMVVAWRGILGFLLTGRTLWPPTGEQSAKQQGASTDSVPASASSWRSPRVLEIGLGVILAVASLISFNISLFAVCLCLIIGVFIEVYGWEKKWIRVLSSVCFILILLQILINISFLFQPSVLVPFVFSVHF